LGAYPLRKDIPKDKKLAQEAINELLRGELERGRIQTREDVLNCLTEAGFEIARVTPKNISIKTDGQNLRLKGAIYEQSFELNRAIEEIQRAKGLGSEAKAIGGNYQARAELEKAVDRRHAEFSRRFGKSKGDHTQRLEKAFQGAVLDNRWGRSGADSSIDISDQRSNASIQQYAGMEAISRTLQGKEQGADVSKLHNERQRNDDLHQGRYSIRQSSIRRRSRLPNYQAREQVNDTDREAFERSVRQISDTAKRACEQIKRTFEQTRERKREIEELARKVFRRIELKLQKQALEKQKEIEAKQQRKFLRDRGMGL